MVRDTGVWNQNQYGIRHGVHGLWIYDTGNTTGSGNLDVGSGAVQTKIEAYANHFGITSYIELEARWANQGYLNFSTTHSDPYSFFKDDPYMYCGGNIVYTYKDTAISWDLDIGAAGNNSIKIHGTGVATSYSVFTTNNDYNSYRGFQNGNHSQAWSNISVKGSSFMSFSHHGNIIFHTRNSANWSDDRLKENAVFIESACETLSKLRPQLYEKKPNMENNDSTTWVKESGLIAQGIYDDAPGLIHLITRTNTVSFRNFEIVFAA